MQMKVSVYSMLRFLLLGLVTVVLVTPGAFSATRSFQTTNPSDPTIVSQVSQQIEIPASSDYFISYDAQNLTLKGQAIEPAIQGISATVIAAIAKSPLWIQPALTRQFKTLSDPESYAHLLLNSSKTYTDEIAFSIACCPSGKVPSPALLKENAESLYEHDQWIQYADIIDYDDGAGNYYSTVRYAVLDNGTEQYFLLPPEIYYWYIVHPKITMEDVDATYGPLWRDYLFEHNDLGYPLLKEKLSTIKYLWDCTSYFQPGDRLWDTWIALHPTAIEAVSYWIGKTVPYPAVGDRPNQPCVIAHEHNGWCGELQQIAVAALRAALIPSIGASNVGEDHVWREFYERGWHENDNWWSDTGGAVNEPDIYGYGWGKNMSAIYQYRGDDTISDDTARYIHPEDRITVNFTVKDSFLQPVDGARITVLVKGPKDISWYKDYFWDKIQGVWEKLPPFLKGKLLTALFEKFKNRYDAIPTEVNGVTITIWNYTDLNGQCSFQLGKNHEYLFLIQEGNLKNPWQLARHNTLRSLNMHTDKDFLVLFPDVSHRPQPHVNQKLPSGDCQVSLTFSSTAYQLQKNFYTGGVGTQDIPGAIEYFFVDGQNFEKYQAGKFFTCFKYLQAGQAILNLSAPQQDWYLIFRNHGRTTNVMVNLSICVITSTDIARVQIVTPSTSVFAVPMFNVGDTVLISGVATGDVILSIENETHMLSVVNGTWSYWWNTSATSPDRMYHVTATCDGTADSTMILLQDGIPPSVEILAPVSGAIVNRSVLAISGTSVDNVGVDHVEVQVDSAPWRTANGTTSWMLSWDLGSLPLGDHTITARAIDTTGFASLQAIPFVVNESGQSWGPVILQLFCLPVNLTNMSNVVVYANVTSTSPFAIAHVVLFFENATMTTSQEMYWYADYPVQARHEEDPMVNESNAPLFGVELGQFASGETITYWVVATDSALNVQQSDTVSFTIL
jgi:hypothetical protein